MKTILLTILILFNTSISRSQNDSVSTNQGFKNNSLSISLGFGGFWIPGILYFERILKQKMRDKKLSSYLRLGLGSAIHWEGPSQFALFQYGIITGNKRKHFEASFGLNCIFHGDAENIPMHGNVFRPDLIYRMLSGSIGYRSQKPNRPYIFRAGIGWPEAIYFGWGYAF